MNYKDRHVGPGCWLGGLPPAASEAACTALPPSPAHAPISRRRPLPRPPARWMAGPRSRSPCRTCTCGHTKQQGVMPPETPQGSAGSGMHPPPPPNPPKKPSHPAASRPAPTHPPEGTALELPLVHPVVPQLVRLGAHRAQVGVGLRKVGIIKAALAPHEQLHDARQAVARLVVRVIVACGRAGGVGSGGGRVGASSSMMRGRRRHASLSARSLPARQRRWERACIGCTPVPTHPPGWKPCSYQPRPLPATPATVTTAPPPHTHTHLPPLP